MTRAYLSLGSNIRPARNIPACLEKLKEAFGVRKISSVYETSPVGPAGPKRRTKFWNLAVEIETFLSRPELPGKLRRLESALGRVRKQGKFAPRPIDIDLILCRKWIQPGFHRLAFVLFPLAEIAPRLKPVGLKRSLAQLAFKFDDPRQEIRKIGKRALLRKSRFFG